MSLRGDRRGRMAAQLGQLSAEAADMGANPEVGLAILEWKMATSRAVRVLLAEGIPKTAIMGAILAPTVDMVIEERDAS